MALFVARPPIDVNVLVGKTRTKSGTIMIRYQSSCTCTSHQIVRAITSDPRNTEDNYKSHESYYQLLHVRDSVCLC